MKNQSKTPTNSPWFSGKIVFLTLLCCTLFSMSSFAQVQSVKGTILDEIGMPLPGVNILETGTKNGATTDFDGNYSLQVGKGATLTVTYIGYKTQTIEVGSKSTININLVPDLQQLEETVIIGYGSVKKKDLTGSVASVKMDKLIEAPVSNFDQALGGRVAGVQVASGSGEPGSSAQIVIRGGNTVNGDNSPLYVVDGFIIEDFNPGLLDSGDIQNIDILKDASATAIYGARGANGVILITTKQTKAGKTVVSYETRFDVSNVSKKMEVLDGYGFVKLANDISITKATENYFTNADGQVVGNVESYRNSPSTDWQDIAFREAHTQTHRFKIASGNEITKVNASINYLEDQGTLLNSDYKKINGTFNLKQNIGDKVDVTLGVIYANNVQMGLDTKGNGTYSFMRNLIGYVPLSNKFIDYGDNSPLDGITDEFYEDGIFNWHPILSLKNEYRRRESDQFITNLSLRYKILPSLVFETQGSYNGVFRQDGQFNNSKTVYGRLVNPINGINGSIDNRYFKTLSNINTLTFNKFFGEHGLTAMIGTSYTRRMVSRTLIRAIQIPEYAESQGINSLDEGTLSNTNDFIGNATEITASLLSRVNYSFKDRYLLTASIRRDGSSKFGPGHNIGYFPSLAASWKVEEEKFLQNVDFISQLKLKVGYGKTGNDRIPSQARFDLFTSDLASYFIDGQEILGQRPTSSGANPDVEWETTSQYNAGLDLGLFDGRIFLTAEVYKKTTDDLLINADTPPSQGVSTGWKNLGSVQNKGIEFALSTVNVSTQNFKWVSDFNISFNTNEVLSLPEGKPIYGNPNYYSRYASNQFIVEQGKSLGNMYGYVSDGVYQPEDFDNYDYNSTSNTLSSGQPSYRNQHQAGDEKYKDINGDGVINSEDKAIIGNGLPKHFGGLGNTFTYKNFDLSIFFQWSYGNDILNANRLIFEEVSYAHQNQYASVANRWTPENQNTDMFRAGGRGFEDVSSRIVEDGSFLRLKTVNFSYNFPKDVVQKLNLTNLKMYVSGQNLFTWTNYSGYDPEVSVNSSAVMPGIDYSAYPRSRTFSFGLNLSF